MTATAIDIVTAARRWAGRLNLTTGQQATAVRLALAPVPPAVVYGDHTDLVRAGVSLMRAPRGERQRRGRAILAALENPLETPFDQTRRDDTPRERAAAQARRRRWARANVAVLHRLARAAETGAAIRAH